MIHKLFTMTKILLIPHCTYAENPSHLSYNVSNQIPRACVAELMTTGYISDSKCASRLLREPMFPVPLLHKQQWLVALHNGRSTRQPPFCSSPSLVLTRGLLGSNFKALPEPD